MVTSVLILYGLVGWFMDRGAKESGAVGDITNIGSSGHTVGTINAGRDVSISGGTVVEDADPARKLFEISVPDDLMPGHIDKYKTKYLPDVWIRKYANKSLVLEFSLEVGGVKFMDALTFHSSVFKEHPEVDGNYFANPLDVSWPNRQKHLAFVVLSGDGADSDFVLMIRDTGTEHEYRLKPGNRWVCLADGSHRRTD